MLRSPLWSVVWSIVRLAAAALGIAAIIAQLVRTVGRATEATTAYGGDIPTVVANFLSFFTIQSNVLAAVVLTIGAIWALVRGRTIIVEPRWLAILLACVTTYMVITGIVYNTLLRGVQLDQGATVAWSNEVLHVVIPVVMLLDLFLAPKRRGLPWGTIGIIAIYPIVWVVYTLLRAPFITSPASGNPWWYPYPFLDPHNFDNGFWGVVVYIVAIAAGIVVVGAFVVWVGRSRENKRADDEVGDPRFTPPVDA